MLCQAGLAICLCAPRRTVCRACTQEVLRQVYEGQRTPLKPRVNLCLFYSLKGVCYLRIGHEHCIFLTCTVSTRMAFFGTWRSIPAAIVQHLHWVEVLNLSQTYFFAMYLAMCLTLAFLDLQYNAENIA